MIKVFKSVSIQHKLTVLSLTVSLVVLSISAFLFYQNQVDLLESSAKEKGKTQAILIGASVESAIMFNDEVSAKKILEQLRIDPTVEFAAILLADKSYFAKYKNNSDKRFPSIHLDREINLQPEYLDVVYQKKDRDELLGYIFIRSNLDKLNENRAYYNNILLAIIFFSITLAYILSFYFKKIITSPLVEIVKFVEDMSVSNDYKKRLDLDLHDELGTLADGFNHMLDAVQEHENELQRHSDKLQDIVDERTKQLYQKAHFDSLTNLPNRYLLLDRLEHAILTARRKNTKMAVLYMDLDRFKTINDTLGHDVGDQLLKAAASLLMKIGRDSDTVARIGGDEFVFLLEEIESPLDSGRVAKKINDIFTRPFHLTDHALHISTSIGISLYPDDGEDATTLLKHADVGMYHSKEKGPGGYSFYKAEMNESSGERLEIENNLRCAIEKNEFHLVYQPQVLLENNKVESVEALLRWESPTLGNISPGVFIPIAEEIGIINQVGNWVITEVCRQLDEWEKQGLEEISVALNVSSSHLLAVDLPDHIENEATRFNITLNQLELEITEDVFLEHSDRIVKVLKRLQSMGVKIAIDDFGTGYSSLRYLKNLPVDILKLDGMFVKDLHDNDASRGIASSTIMLAHSLNMKLVAECVETAEQLEYLKENNCDYVQGYYLYRPMLPKDLLKTLK